MLTSYHENIIIKLQLTRARGRNQCAGLHVLCTENMFHEHSERCTLNIQHAQCTARIPEANGVNRSSRKRNEFS